MKENLKRDMCMRLSLNLKHFENDEGCTRAFLSPEIVTFSDFSGHYEQGLNSFKLSFHSS